MIHSLEKLLAGAGYSPPANADLRDHIVFLNNYASVPRSRLWPDSFLKRGFQLLLLDHRRQPTHYARISAVDDLPFARECDLLSTLTADPDLSEIVPPSESASDEWMRVSIADYWGGRPVREWSTLGPVRWLSRAREVLDVRDDLCRRAAALLLSSSEKNEKVKLDKEVGVALQYLHQDDALDGQNVAVIEAALASVRPILAAVQHGDFWEGNLLYHASSWRVIDFEDFGRIKAPLYDVFNLIQSSARSSRSARGGDWYARGKQPAPRRWQRTWRTLIDERAGRLGLGDDEVAALLVYYSVELCAHRKRPGAGRVAWTRPLRDLRVISRLLEELSPRYLLPG